MRINLKKADFIIDFFRVQHRCFTYEEMKFIIDLYEKTLLVKPNIIYDINEE